MLDVDGKLFQIEMPLHKHNFSLNSVSWFALIVVATKNVRHCFNLEFLFFGWVTVTSTLFMYSHPKFFNFIVSYSSMLVEENENKRGEREMEKG